MRNKEYIEREFVVKILQDEAKSAYPTPYHIGLYAASRAIGAIPAADVRPVVKARWVYTDMSRLVCSNCGNPVAFALKEDGWHHGDFCPNCGADMRGEVE